MRKFYLFAVFSLMAGLAFAADADSGKRLDHVFVYAGSEVSSKIIYIYNSDGSLQSMETMMLNNDGVLTNNSREVYGYDAEGRMNDYESYVWHASSMSWLGSPKEDAKKHMTFDDQNRIAEVDYYKWDSSIEKWGEHVYLHGVYTYDGNVAIEDRERWLNDKFSTADRRRYEFDDAGRLVTYVRYSNGAFSFEVGDYVYTPTDSVVYSYDDHGNITEQSSFMYIDSWVDGERLKYEYTYDEYGNIATKTSYRWDDWTDDWMSGSTLTYENHYLADTDTYDLPYTRDYAQSGALEATDAVDGNADGSTWRIENGALVCSSSTASEAPDILYLPPLNMASDTEVKIVFNARLANDCDSAQIQMILCSNDEELTPLGAVGNIHTIEPGEGSEVEGYIIAPQNGAFRIGICFNNSLVGSQVAIDTLTVYNYRPSNTPMEPYGLSAIAANDQSLQVQIDFYAPVYTIGGDVLGSVDKMEVYRNGSAEPVYTTEEVGASLVTRWVDTDAVKGENTYEIYAYANGQKSDPATILVVAGYARPAEVRNLSIVERADYSCVISWDKPEGIDGGEMYDCPIYYTVIRNNETIVANAVTGTSVVDNTIPCEYGQTPVFYTILSSNLSGEGRRTYSELYFIGAPYSAPYAESFAGGAMNTMWLSDKLEGLDSGWGIGEQAYSPDAQPQDGDGGLASFMATNVNVGTKTRLTSAKINIGNLSEPALGFYIYQTTGEKSNDNLTVEVSRNNGEFVAVAGPLYASGNETEGWVKKVIPLDAYQGETALRLSFVGEAVDGTTNINIDNIQVQERSVVGIADNRIDKYRVYATTEGQIVVKAQPGSECSIDVYGIGGQKVYATQGDEAIVDAAPGIYVVDVEGARYKVVVK